MLYESKQTEQGFTLIELMVTISIVVIVTGLALVRYSSFNSTVLLNSETHEIALDIRRAQAYGLSASGLGGSYRDPYGIYFDLSNPSQYIFFQDGNRNGVYDSTEQLEVITIDPRYEISEICTETSCNTSTGRAVILFQRPNFTAEFWSSFDSSVSELSVRLAEAQASSPASRLILVETTGYIDVQQ